MQNSWGIPLALVCIAAVLMSGCTNAELGVIEDTPAPIAIPTTEQPAIQPPTLTPTPVTTSPPTKATTAVTTKVTTAAPKGPALAKKVTISLGANEMKRFTTIGAGSVRVITIMGGKEKECNGGGAVTLSGPDYDATLASNSQGRSVPNKIIHIPGPGEYTLATRGCYGWQIVVDNWPA
ncbi:MAG: hypothetical protein WC455_29675 [Dehalococcoidia bacterium]